MITSTTHIWALAMGLVLCSLGWAAEELTIARLSPDRPAQAWEPVEFRIEPGRSYENPFKSAEVAIDVVLTSPAGKELRQPAFWYQQVTVTATEKLPKVERQESFWMARICPTAPGRWKIAVEAKDSADTRRSPEQAFEVVASEYTRGFVRVATNKRYFAFDSGESYFPIGINMGWGTWGLWADQFDGWFASLAENDGNFARVWMAVGKWLLEPPGRELTRYDLSAAAFYDDLLAAASKRGVYVMLCVINHRDLIEKDMWGDAIWPKSPYNAANGGPATRPVDFFTHQQARSAFKDRLRYIVARYGAYRSLAVWELFNEQEFANCGPQVEWNREMSEYIKSIDPYQHLVSTSCQNLPAELWKLPSIDLTQAHYYGDDTTIDLVTPSSETSRKLQGFGKPQVLAEFGISYKRSDNAFDEKGIATTLHNGQWAAMMNGSAGGAWHWWWDSYVAPKDLWHVYKPFAAFAKQIDWAKRDFRPLGNLAVERILSGPDTLGDAVLPCSGGWGKNVGGPITIDNRGKPDRALPAHLYAEVAKKDLYAPTVLNVDLARETEMVLRIASVSDLAVIRVSLDGKPLRDLAFSALPGAEDIESPTLFDGKGPWQAVVNKERTIKLPAGKHSVTLDNRAGDWIKLESVTLKNAVSAKYAEIQALAIQDTTDSQTLVWILDDRSNWKSDKEGGAPGEVAGALVRFPVKARGTYGVTWWDTRRGQPIMDAARMAPSESGELQLMTPSFTRDIAAIVTRR